MIEAYQTKILTEILEQYEKANSEPQFTKQASVSVTKETNTSDLTFSSTQLDVEAKEIEMDIAETLKKMSEKKPKLESIIQNKLLEEKFPLKMIEDENLNLQFDFPVRNMGRCIPPKDFFPEDLTSFTFQPITGRDYKINCRPIFLEDSYLSKNPLHKKSRNRNFSEDPQTISSSSNSNSWIEGGSEQDYLDRLPCFNFTNIIDAGTFQISINDLGQEGKTEITRHHMRHPFRQPSVCNRHPDFSDLAGRCKV